MPDEQTRPLGNLMLLLMVGSMRSTSRRPCTLLADAPLLDVTLRGGRSYVQGSQQAFIRDPVGVALRYLLAPGENEEELAAEDTRKLIDEAQLDPSTVDLVVFATRNRPPPAAEQCDALRGFGAGTPVASFDIALGCSGYVDGLPVCETLMTARGARNAVLVTCDPYRTVGLCRIGIGCAVFLVVRPVVSEWVGPAGWLRWARHGAG